MEHLTKQQIILLALLVSFVSSIATGIVTISLLDQAPPAVTQTINRVVEKTIERVGPNASSTVETVIVKEDEATIDAIEKVSKSLVRIMSGGQEIGLGVITSSSGTIVAKTRPITDTVTGNLDGGNEVSLALVTYDPSTEVSVFKAEQGTDLRSARAYSPVELANSDVLKLGQSAIAIGGGDNPYVSTGIISALTRRSASDRSVNRILTSIRESAFDSDGILVNLLGEVIGIKSGDRPENGFIPSNVIRTYAAP